MEIFLNLVDSREMNTSSSEWKLGFCYDICPFFSFIAIDAFSTFVCIYIYVYGSGCVFGCPLHFGYVHTRN